MPSKRRLLIGHWQAALETEEATHARAVAREVAGRLRDPARVESAVASARQQTAYPRSVHWRPEGVAQGYAGLALLWGAADACMPGEGWDIVGHEHLRRAVRAAEQERRLTHSMYSGLGGLAFTSWYLSRGGIRYNKLLRTVDTALVDLVMSATATLSAGHHHGVSVSTFDVISGLAGVGRYLLLRRDERPHRMALEAVLRFLALLTEEKDGLPHWHTPSRCIADEAWQQAYPHGNLNCGLAHGIPGPLALLSMAAIDGVIVEGQSEAIGRIAEWLWQSRSEDRWGLNWPTAVPLDLEKRSPSATLAHAERIDAACKPSRTAWCYGSPGIARSLWLAGEALHEASYKNIAVAAMEAVYRRPLSARQIDSPTFCHGVAGLQQITLRFADESNLPLFIDAARALHRQMIDAFEPASVLGYRNLEPGGGLVDQPGVLDGAAGIALVLLAASTPVEPLWDMLFLLS
jgi:hypothetical protein